MKKFTLFLCMLFSLTAFGQQTNAVEMADKFREDGKIYIVIAVVLVILLGILTYLIMLDKKISRLEKEIKADNKK